MISLIGGFLQEHREVRKVQLGLTGLLRCPVTFCTDWKQQLRLNVDGLGPC